MTERAVALLVALAFACSHDARSGAANDACAALGGDGTVVVEGGQLRGISDDGTCAFLGVPYAAPPVRTMRFRPPARTSPWQGVREANAFAPACPQLDARFDAQSEDCLYLNVWRPAQAEAALRPLLVFVHGGGNVSGSASEPELRGAWLARQTGAVVATFDYRLGALGYLSHPSLAVEDAHGSSGNYGLLDQIAALEWLQRNAAALGADPTRMVAFGQSAGSRNLCAIAGSPLATKLLSGVILQSGACNLRDLSAKYAFGQDVARETGCGTAADVAGCLRAVPPDVLAKALPSLPNPMTISQYNPAVDGWSIVDEPLARLRSGAHGIPVIVGSNAEEVGNVMPWIESETQYVTLVEALFGRELAPIVLSSYPAADYPSPRDALVAAVTEARYTCPALATADAAAEGGSAYLYVFSQGLAGGPEATFGAYHGLELLFLFGAFDARGYHAGTEERALAVELAGFYGRFAQIGDPQAFATAGVPRWPLYTASEQPFLRLTTPLTPDARPAARRCEIWQGAE